MLYLKLIYLLHKIKRLSRYNNFIVSASSPFFNSALLDIGLIRKEVNLQYHAGQVGYATTCMRDLFLSLVLLMK